jgi:hypothetical protein
MTGRGFVVAGAIAVAVVAGLFVFFPRGKGKRAVPPVKPVIPTSPAQGRAGSEEKPTAKPAEAPEITVEPPRPEPPPPGKRHIEITVQPAEAALLLDNRMAGGNAIKMDVTKAKTVHVVQARAPGYAPFRKTITYANDIYLDIKLEKVEAPAVQSRAKAHPPQVAVPKETKPEVKEVKPETKPAPAVAAPVEDFGMTLQRPAARRPTKRIDETDPYAP